jgi:hypothetical protein
MPSAPINNTETAFFGDGSDRSASTGFLAYDHPNSVEYYFPGNVRITETYTGVGAYPRPSYNSTPWMMGVQASSTAGAKLYYNGNVNRSPLAVATFATGTFTEYIGSTLSGAAFTIHEVIFYDADLTDANRQKIEGYLAWKWGIQSFLPAGHLYKTAAPV